MVKNYLVSAIRNFRRNSFFSSLNIIGLAVGIASALLILQYVQYENSYDRFNSNADRIYRIQYNNYQNGKLTFECAAAVPAVGPALKNNFPEIEYFVRMLPTDGVITYISPDRGELSFMEERIQFVDESIFDIYDFELIMG
ncbi:MAG: ABC transporter permease, partial [Cyclobacteriaceae bacterium]